MSDEYDAPRKMPVEACDRVSKLSELQHQTCQLFEEFLLLDDPEFRILEEPLPASNLRSFKEEADSPVYKSLAKTRGLQKGHIVECSLDDDVVPDAVGVSPLTDDVVPDRAGSFPVGLASGAPVEQDEKQEYEKDDKMKDLAVELAKAGDALVLQYGSNVKEVEGKLVQLVKQEAANLTYERFSRAIEDLVGKDKNWTNFVFAFQVGKRVCKHSREVYNYSKIHFQQYVQSFCETMEEAGDIESFVYQQSPMAQ